MWTKDEKHVLSFCDGTVDGFIFLGPRLSPEMARHFFRAAPMISVHNAGAISGAINIDTDSESGAYMITKHLIDLGHRRIAHVTGAPFRAGTDERLAGYRRALAEAGIELDPRLLIRGFYSMASGIDAGKELIERFSFADMPTGIFCANDASACGVVGVLRAQGIRVPEDVSVVGFDDEPIAHVPVLNLTTVRQPLKSMAVHAVSLLLKAIDESVGEPNRIREVVLEHNRATHYQDIENARVDYRTVLFAPRIIIRQSSAPPRNP
jgi:LacI family transcriptional regulator